MADYNCPASQDRALPQREPRPDTLVFHFSGSGRFQVRFCCYNSKLLSRELVHDIFQPAHRKNTLFSWESKSHQLHLASDFRLHRLIIKDLLMKLHLKKYTSTFSCLTPCQLRCMFMSCCYKYLSKRPETASFPDLRSAPETRHLNHEIQPVIQHQLLCVLFLQIFISLV